MALTTEASGRSRRVFS